MACALRRGRVLGRRVRGGVLRRRIHLVGRKRLLGGGVEAPKPGGVGGTPSPSTRIRPGEATHVYKNAYWKFWGSNHRHKKNTPLGNRGLATSIDLRRDSRSFVLALVYGKPSPQRNWSENHPTSADKQLLLYGWRSCLLAVWVGQALVPRAVEGEGAGG